MQIVLHNIENFQVFLQKKKKKQMYSFQPELNFHYNNIPKITYVK